MRHQGTEHWTRHGPYHFQGKVTPAYQALPACHNDRATGTDRNGMGQKAARPGINDVGVFEIEGSADSRPKPWLRTARP
jgi:hypothetical protein